MSKKRPPAGTIGWHDLTVTDATGIREFYEAVVGWRFETAPMGDYEDFSMLAACRELSRDKGIDATLKKHRLDAIIAPTGGPAWKIDRITGDHLLGGSSEPAAVAGYPSITVPAGFVFGLPVGISFFSTAWQESTLIRMTYAFEQATGARKAPEFRAEADLD